MKRLILIFSAASLLFSFSLEAQKFYTKEGHIKFFSSTPVEDIHADNYQVSSVLNGENGQMAFSILMKGFEFEKALMQEHFNEKYVHSDEYPKATFKGKINGWEDISLKEDGKVEVTVTGTMTIHGVEKEIEQEGVLTIADGAVTAANATFNVKPEDYDIKIPALVRENIAKEMEVTVDMDYKIYGN